MIKRTLTGAALILAVTGFFLLRNIDISYFEILILIFIAFGTYEMLRAFKDKTDLYQKITVIVFSVLFVPIFHFFGIFALFISFFVLIFLLVSGLVIIKSNTLEGVGFSLFSAFYPSFFLLTMLIINNFSNNSLVALLFVFIISPAADTMAYLTGMTFKGPKLCPQISPNKTISGAIGGLFGGIIASLILYIIFKDSFIYYNDFPLIAVFIIIGFLGAFFTEFGDLVESSIKRKAGIKDMGNLLPGHGGILDRIDGIIYCSVFVFVSFAILV